MIFRSRRHLFNKLLQRGFYSSRVILKSLLCIALCFCVISCEEDMTKKGALVPKTVNEDNRLPSLNINGTQLHVETYGNKNDPMLVVLHGGPGADYRSMLQVKELASLGFFVIFYDQRGSGLSKRESRNHYQGTDVVQLFIDDLDAIIEHFHSSSRQKVFLLGHSWGAMLATAYINQNPYNISGAILAEPGGLSWKQTEEYLERSNKIKFFSEALNDATFPEQIFAGRSEHEILDYKASFFSTYENAPGNTIGNPSNYPFWRNGAVVFSETIDYAEEHGFDFTTNLDKFTPPILFLYSEKNKAYGLKWADKVAAPYPNSEIAMVSGAGHEMIYFAWDNFYPLAKSYLNQMK
jgi:proline iminopeptidase